MAEGEGVDWLEGIQPTSCRTLIECVKTVRNNLVHGDKWRNRDRDEQLIQASLYILNEIYRETSDCSEFDRFVENLNWKFQGAASPGLKKPRLLRRGFVLLKLFLKLRA